MDNDKLKMSGKVIEVLQGGNFRVQLENNMVIMSHVSGKMRINKINILPGDIVDVEFSPYDVTRGRITFRHRDVVKKTS